MFERYDCIVKNLVVRIYQKWSYEKPIISYREALRLARIEYKWRFDIVTTAFAEYCFNTFIKERNGN